MECHACHEVGSLVKKIDQDGNTILICHQCNDVYDFFTTKTTQRTIKDHASVTAATAKQGIFCLNCKAIIVGKHCSCGAINPLSKPRKKRT